jgi:DNA uptake protein ComE-like DNA-binding protein
MGQEQEPASHSFVAQSPQAEQQLPLSQQQTLSLPAVSAPLEPPEPGAPASRTKLPLKRKLKRIIAIAVVLGLAVALFFIWHPPTSTPSAPGITQQNFSGTSSNTASSTGDSTSTSGDIHVYVVGAVKHPGVYTLPVGARVYQLLQAAGGALSNANLVALNLAASLTDGEEVYVIVNGEIPPAYLLGDAPLDAILHLQRQMHDRTYSLVGSFLASTEIVGIPADLPDCMR